MTTRDGGLGPRATLRVAAFASLGYAYLALLVGLLAMATYLLAARADSGLAIMTGALAVYLLSALHVRTPPPTGRVVSPAEAPALFRLVEEVRDAIGAPAVHHVVLAPDANAFVVDLPRYTLFGSRRYLAIGVPLLYAFPVDELRALLAHELAHLAYHGRMRLWAARVQATWTALAMSAQWSGSPLRILLVPFFRWYAPRMGLLVESVSRRDELEADRLAAAHAGAAAVARTLVRVGVVNAHVQEVSLPLLFRESAEHPEPPGEHFDRALRRAPEPGWADEHRWIECLLGERSLDTDSHPSLTDRLSALGIRQPDPRLLARELERQECGAAVALLEPSGESLVADVASSWAEETKVAWRRLVADAEIWSAAAAEDAQAARWVRWARARWGAFCEPPEAAIERLAAVVAEADEPEARFLLGSLLARRPGSEARARGRLVLESVMAEESNFALEAAELLQRVYVRDTRSREVARCKRRAAELRAAFLRALLERSRLSPGDELRAHPLPSASAQRLVAELRRHERVSRAFLVQKRTRNLTASPVVVLAFETRAPWYRPDFGKARRTCAEELVERVILPQTLDLVVVPIPSRSRIARRLEKLPWARVYARDAPTGHAYVPTGLAWDRATWWARRGVGTPLLVVLAVAGVAAGFALTHGADESVATRPPAPDPTIAELREAAARAPYDARVQLRLGEALFLSRAPEDALPVLEEAVRLAPDDAAAHYYLGATLLGLHRAADAEPSLRRATELDSLDASSRAVLAMTLNDLGRAREGEPIVRRALELEDQDPYAYAVLGTILKNLGRADEATRAFERITELDPEDPRAWLELGVLEHLAGDYPTSVRALERARALDPERFDRLVFERGVLEASRAGRPYSP